MITAGSLISNTDSLTGDILNNAALVFDQAANGSFSGDIAGSGTLIKTGTGILTLTGQNAYAGGTVISAGTLVGNTDSLTGDILNNAALVFDQAANGSFSGDIGGSGSLTKSGAGILRLEGSSSYTGGTTVAGGTLVGDAESLAGNIVNNAALVFDQATDGAYAGNISGGGSLTKSGAGSLILTGNNSYTGGTTISAGTLVGNTTSLQGEIANNAALVFDQAASGTFAGNISGSGSLTKTGGGGLTWSGTGTFTGGTYVMSGMLSVDGSLSSLVTIGNRATLAGTGNVGSFITGAGASIAPGNSIGTINVANVADFGDGSAYLVEVDSSGRSDLIAAGGTAIISSNAAVRVSPENGMDNGSTYGRSKTYTIVSAEGGVTGTFGSVSDDFAYLTSSLSYDATSVYLTLDRVAFSSQAENPNQLAVANAVDALGPGPLFETLLYLKEGEASGALDALSGQIHASLRAALADQAHNFPRLALRHLSAAPAYKEGDLWTVSLGQFAHFDETSSARATHANTGGFYVGRDLYQEHSWHLGILGGYAHSSIKEDGAPAEADIDTFELGFYGSLEAENLNFRFGNAQALHAISTHRPIHLSTYTDTLSADYMAARVQGFGELAYEIELPHGRLEPFFNAEVLYQTYSSFSENPGTAALSGRTQNGVSAFTTLGIRLDERFMLGNTVASLQAEVGWRHRYDDATSEALLTFAEGDPFKVSGVSSARDSFNVHLGLDVAATENASVGISYAGEFSTSGDSQTVKAGLSIKF